jgi:hypothetical protein
VARLIAYYLPQFYPIPENDQWWGHGFTDWDSVRNAKPLFQGHLQPRIPGELGYYDLRNPEIRLQQADLAASAGIEGFCYWHYWFGNGKRLLHKIFDEVLESGQPEMPFCLAWANHSWYKNKFSDSRSMQLLIKQEYRDTADFADHFRVVLKAFQDPRYIRIDQKPIFVIYRPFELPEPKRFIDLWQKWAVEAGLPGIHFIGYSFLVEDIDSVLQLGFDSVNLIRLYHFKKETSKIEGWMQNFRNRYLKEPLRIPYEIAARSFDGPEDEKNVVFPSLIPNWDHSPRSGSREPILVGHNPQKFKEHTKRVFGRIKQKPNEYQIVFIKSWNEWAEGNYLEPDHEFGRGFLHSLASCQAGE